jgi:hypothetical protein
MEMEWLDKEKTEWKKIDQEIKIDIFEIDIYC